MTEKLHTVIKMDASSYLFFNLFAFTKGDHFVFHTIKNYDVCISTAGVFWHMPLQISLREK